MGTKQAAFPGAGTGLGPPPGRVGLGSNRRAWGVTPAVVGRAPAGTPQSYPPRLVLSQSRSPSLQTRLSVHWISPLFIFSRCGLGVKGAGWGASGGAPSPPPPTCGMDLSVQPLFCAWLCLQGGYNPLFPPCGPGPALTAFITIIINRVC